MCIWFDRPSMSQGTVMIQAQNRLHEKDFTVATPEEFAHRFGGTRVINKVSVRFKCLERRARKGWHYYGSLHYRLLFYRCWSPTMVSRQLNVCDQFDAGHMRCLKTRELCVLWRWLRRKICRRTRNTSKWQTNTCLYWVGPTTTITLMWNWSSKSRYVLKSMQFGPDGATLRKILNFQSCFTKITSASLV